MFWPNSAGANAGYSGQFSLRVFGWRESPAAWLSFWSLGSMNAPRVSRKVLIFASVPLLIIAVLVDQGHRQRRKPVLVAFTGSNGDLLHLEIHVFDPQPHRFHDAQATAIKQLHDGLRFPIQQAHHLGHFLARKGVS